MRERDLDGRCCNAVRGGKGELLTGEPRADAPKRMGEGEVVGQGCVPLSHASRWRVCMYESRERLPRGRRKRSRSCSRVLSDLKVSGRTGSMNSIVARNNTGIV